MQEENALLPPIFSDFFWGRAAQPENILDSIDLPTKKDRVLR